MVNSIFTVAGTTSNNNLTACARIFYTRKLAVLGLP